ncbi:2430_t:CDS:2, partial [Cetraspora pellucida]
EFKRSQIGQVLTPRLRHLEENAKYYRRSDVFRPYYKISDHSSSIIAIIVYANINRTAQRQDKRQTAGNQALHLINTIVTKQVMNGKEGNKR